MTPNKVNLYINGSDFYRGSTRKELKNGWCDFRVLGNILVKRHFGSSFDVGKIWYVTDKDTPEVQYGQGQRKKLWLGALGAGVGPKIVDDYRKAQFNVALGMQAVADAAKARPGEYAPYAIVISAPPDSLSPMQVINRDHDSEVVLVIPPDLGADIDQPSCGFEVARIDHSDLERSRLDDTISSENGRSYTWDAYIRSKEDSRLVVEYCHEAWEALKGIVERELRGSQIHNSIVPDAIRSRLDVQVERFLRSGQRFDKYLLGACGHFITQQLIDWGTRACVSPNAVKCKYLPVNDGDLGRTYRSLFGDYLANARSIRITDPYVREEYQVGNVEDLLAIVREPKGCCVELVTSFKGKVPLSFSEIAILRVRLDELGSRLVRKGFMFSYKIDPRLHDRAIDTEEWRIGLGRGLDIYYCPEPGQVTRQARACDIYYVRMLEPERRKMGMPPLPGGLERLGEDRSSARAVPGVTSLHTAAKAARPR